MREIRSEESALCLAHEYQYLNCGMLASFLGTSEQYAGRILSRWKERGFLMDLGFSPRNSWEIEFARWFTICRAPVIPPFLKIYRRDSSVQKYAQTPMPGAFRTSLNYMIPKHPVKVAEVAVWLREELGTQYSVISELAIRKQLGWWDKKMTSDSRVMNHVPDLLLLEAGQPLKEAMGIRIEVQLTPKRGHYFAGRHERCSDGYPTLYVVCDEGLKRFMESRVSRLPETAVIQSGDSGALQQYLREFNMESRHHKLCEQKVSGLKELLQSEDEEDSEYSLI